MKTLEEVVLRTEKKKVQAFWVGEEKCHSLATEIQKFKNFVGRGERKRNGMCVLLVGKWRIEVFNDNQRELRI